VAFWKALIVLYRLIVVSMHYIDVLPIVSTREGVRIPISRPKSKSKIRISTKEKEIDTFTSTPPSTSLSTLVTITSLTPTPSPTAHSLPSTTTVNMISLPPHHYPITTLLRLRLTRHSSYPLAAVVGDNDIILSISLALRLTRLPLFNHQHSPPPSVLSNYFALRLTS